MGYKMTDSEKEALAGILKEIGRTLGVEANGANGTVMIRVKTGLGDVISLNDQVDKFISLLLVKWKTATEDEKEELDGILGQLTSVSLTLNQTVKIMAPLEAPEGESS